MSRPLRNSFWYGITGVLATVGFIIFWISKIFLRLRESAMKAAKDATNANESNGATAADASAAVKTEEELDWNVFSRLQNHQSIKRLCGDENELQNFDHNKNGLQSTGGVQLIAI